MSPNVPLTQRQRRAVLALVTAPTLTAAAEAAGLSRKTLGRWMQSPEFRAAYRSEARRCHEEATSAVLALSRRAVDTLAAGMTEGTAADRTRAARAVLELSVRINEDDVAERLTELEQAVKAWDTTTKLGLVR